ncbi:hypothetical protein CDV36_011442 [Fusarium kuroshium]|uniref:Uncharacterized protein n=1 Tax=Fusarium kuroshium TaxID=2010991 RepID=A0A3M2RVJ6_9HYPO|nr:hypothetical protein CDV36_011442 [Fusarium kuroshium]
MNQNLIKQEIETQYIDPGKIAVRLSELFPGVKCRIKWYHLNQVDPDEDVVILHVPRLLTEEEKISLFEEETK